MHRAQDPAYQLSPSVLIFREQVSPPVPGSGEQALLIVSKLGQLELGAGAGVICEVYSLFWKAFQREFPLCDMIILWKSGRL